jgi:hypothetical protein
VLQGFLEFMNSILLTGEVAGLFAKDEMLTMSTDLRPAFLAARPGVPDSLDNLKQYFVDCVRDNLHVVLCMRWVMYVLHCLITRFTLLVLQPREPEVP